MEGFRPWSLAISDLSSIHVRAVSAVQSSTGTDRRPASDLG